MSRSAGLVRVAHQGAVASLGGSGGDDGDAEGGGLFEGGSLAGGALREGEREGLRDGVALGTALLVGTAVGEGLGEGLVEVARVVGVVEEVGAGRCGVTEVGDGVAVTDGEGVAAVEAGGGSQVSVGSTKGMIVSGRTGPPAKLTPTIAVYATPAAPRK